MKEDAVHPQIQPEPTQLPPDPPPAVPELAAPHIHQKHIRNNRLDEPEPETGCRHHQQKLTGFYSTLHKGKQPETTALLDLPGDDKPLLVEVLHNDTPYQDAIEYALLAGDVKPDTIKEVLQEVEVNG